jgi:CHAT domain-containing protein
VSLGSAAVIDAAIAKWRERIQVELQSGGLAAARNEASYRQAGTALRALVWDPIAAQVGAAASTFIVPDGALHLVDFATLPTGRASYLVEGPSTLHYLLAERDLLQPAGEPRGGSLLALGAPDFEKVNRSALAALQQPQLTADASSSLPPASPPASREGDVGLIASRHLSRSACEAFGTQTFAPLPATTEEVRHIAALWRQGAESEGRTLLLGGDSASESVFKSLAPGHRVLHLATHGFFLDRDCVPSILSTTSTTATVNRSTAAAASARLLEESPLLRSGLVLAGANRRTDASSEDDDGMLTAEEIAGLDLSSAQWTVLSACDTGRGDWQAGEGVLGLRRAFQVAGARTVILSLWPVIDTVAADWMTALYKRKFVEHASTASAVRAANRTLLAARRAAGQSTHPLYWSGFIATGDWR